MKAKGWTTGLVALWLVGFAHGSAAQEATLIFATTNQPTAHLNVRVQHPWAKRINEAGQGVVRIDVRDGPTLANHVNFYSRVVDDVAQISWGVHGFVAGKFPLSEVGSLPFEVDKSEPASVALWRLWKSGLLDREYNEVVPLYVVAFPQTGIHTARPMKAPDSLAGLKIISGQKITAEVVTRLGGTPISLPITDIYEGIQRGTADGVIQQWTAFQPFKLAEVTTYHVDTTLSGATGMVFISKKRYDALPAAARKVIDDHSGEAQSRRFGAFWDSVQDEGRQMVKARGDKHTIVRLTPEQEKSVRDKIAPVAAEWARSTPGGDKVLGAYRELIAKVKSGS
jgi:TRAP-type C4-dicarboxylate transport system substrate-binding protein